MLSFMKQKTPYIEVKMHDLVAVEAILYPDPKIYHCTFMGMIFDDKSSDSVKINTDLIKLETGEQESFELKLTIPGLREFAETNN